MASRFHLQSEAWTSTAFALTGDEATHCVQVLRQKVGDHVIIFDGAGNEAIAEITAISSSKGILPLHKQGQDALATSGKRVDLKIIERRFSPAPAVSISLIQAIPKGANMEWIIEKAVELGVNEIFPVLTERTVVRLDAKEAAKKQEKWQRVALEACKQCGQNWLPKIHPPVSFLATLDSLPPHDLKIIAALQPDAKPLKTVFSEKNHSSLVFAIGPEGDFSPPEYAAAREHGFVPATLGPLVLRVETAAFFTLSVLVHELRVLDLNPEAGQN